MHVRLHICSKAYVLGFMHTQMRIHTQRTQPCTQTYINTHTHALIPPSPFSHTRSNKRTHKQPPANPFHFSCFIVTSFYETHTEIFLVNRLPTDSKTSPPLYLKKIRISLISASEISLTSTLEMLYTQDICFINTSEMFQKYLGNRHPWIYRGKFPNNLLKPNIFESRSNIYTERSDGFMRLAPRSVYFDYSDGYQGQFRSTSAHESIPCARRRQNVQTAVIYTQVDLDLLIP